MRHFLLLFVLFFSFTAAQAQFRMVGNASWTTQNDSTYSATVSFQTDLTGQGFLPTQITTGFRVFSPTEQLYRVDAVLSSSFSSAEIRIVEIGATDGAPSGQVMVFDPQGRQAIPQVPFGSIGATAQLQAAVTTYNARVTDYDGTQVIQTIRDGGFVDRTELLDSTSMLRLEITQAEADAKAYADANDDNTQLSEAEVDAFVGNNGYLTSFTETDPVWTSEKALYATTTYADQAEQDAKDYADANDDNTQLSEAEVDAFVGNNGYLTAAVPYSQDVLASGSFTAEVDRYAGNATTLTNPSAGEYRINAATNAHLDVITIYADNSTLNASQELVIKVDNSTNTRKRRFAVQIYDANNGALVDQQLTGTVHTQFVAADVTTITIPGLNGFGSTGYIIELR